MSIEAMEQALEALNLAFEKDLTYLSDHAMIARQDVVRSRLAITALRAAIAEAPRRKWVGLTDEEMPTLTSGLGPITLMPFRETKALIRAIESKLKEKNGG